MRAGNLTMICTVQARVAILNRIADALLENQEEILRENAADVDHFQDKISQQLLQRLKLKPQKIQQLADGIRSIARQEEPLRKVLKHCKCISPGPSHQP